MAIQVIFSDIDGTLITTHHQLTERTIHAVHACAKQNIPFILVSARMPSGILPLQQRLGLAGPMICYSGALIVDSVQLDGEPLQATTLAPQAAKTVWQQVDAHFPSVSFSAYSFDRWLVPEPANPWVLQEQAIAATPMHRFDFLENPLRKWPPLHKILCMGAPEEIDALEQRLTDVSLDAIFYKSKSTYLEITSKQVSKASAMQHIIDFYHVAREQTLAFGDNYNDVPMLRYAGVGVAMANAPMQVKGSADYITLSNDQDGIAAALERFSVLPAAY
ncbi:Cof-type HAD-IIB family hydrolase [Sporolactobacillus terrae]|uniref:Cof-type HAD-IIB family hydrolase n=1 Tax=Sporolactobacillus terrae TaxID=269673 RepID=A0ABX5Q935_9BACL|nr:Cof-type HAD-IIB family hydrolase [Sporolactobacillus terrae]QAA23120.1 Cof-type HAD-IIB family hydrolase [Sporolactobacillus terrae]QAA26090.1 Cof-type HAD-IIB family hydrolase [Sporolactobacillus terrae]UAK15184.1 Cof-type HAD-IIB family hydrolase [Sporolactobacillus terrae]